MAYRMNEEWQIAGDGETLNRENNGNLVIVDRSNGDVFDEEFPTRVCSVEFYGKAKRGHAWQAPANADPLGLDRARLIAAAPQLHAALKVCAAVLAGEGPVGKTAIIKALEQANAAMAKVVGK